MDIADEEAARAGHRKILAKRLLDGANLVDAVQEDPALIFGYKRTKMDLE